MLDWLTDPFAGGLMQRALAEVLILAAGVTVALVLAHRRLALSVFDRAAAPSLGARPARWDLVLLALLALTVVAAVDAVGALLAASLLVIPAAAARLLTRRPGSPCLLYTSPSPRDS